MSEKNGVSQERDDEAQTQQNGGKNGKTHPRPAPLNDFG